jgi:periplasmic copper chaperone A
MPLARTALALAIGLAACATALAQVKVDEPWVRGTVAAQKATGAFMRVTAVEDARLVAARSPVAGVVELHEMKMESGVMKMRAVGSIALPAGRAVSLEPGGYHVMLMGLKQPLAEGEAVPLTLVVESKGGQRSEVEVKATVRPLTAPAPASGQGQHKH